MNDRSDDSVTNIHSLIYPYFLTIYERLGTRTPPSNDRIRKFKLLSKKIVSFFSEARSYQDLDSQRRWREFQRYVANTLSRDSLRVLTQDVNALLLMLHEDNRIGRIRLKSINRKLASSEGFHVEYLLDFTWVDIKRLWESIEKGDNEEMALLFLLVISTCTPVSHLVHLKVSGIREQIILIKNGGLVCSILQDPGFTRLWNYIRDKVLKKDDRIFARTAGVSFTRWLAKECKKASVPIINSSQLFYFSRFLLVIEGAPPYAVACLGSQNSFAPFNAIAIKREV